MASLSDYFKVNPFVSTVPTTGGVTTPMFSSRTQTLPNGGGLFQSPVVAQPTAPVAPVKPATPVFSPAPTAAPAPAPVDLYSKYRDPKTGNVMSPEEYAIFLGNKVPAQKANGDVSKYAGDAMVNPGATDLPTQATNLNNTRNDIATGTTDPYKVGAQSGIAYSPTELAAIEKAYAGIYDPALNDVFARLKEQKTKEDAKQKQADQIFATNESIRQWKETTGTGPTYNGTSNQFTKTQINTGAVNAGMAIEDFTNLDDDLKNFFIKNPQGLDDATNKATPMSKIFKDDIDAVKKGTMTVKEVTDNIMASNLSDTVKHYFIDQLPLTDVEKQGFFSQIWGAVSGLFNGQ